VGGAVGGMLLLAVCALCLSKLMLQKNTDPAVNNMRFVSRARAAAADSAGGRAVMANLARMAAEGGGAVGGGAAAGASDWGGTGTLAQSRKNSSAAALAKELSRPEPVLNPLASAAADVQRAVTNAVQAGPAAALRAESAAVLK
jgi:hypothetical protein